MQEIKKRRILLASVLKPADDIRMTRKIGMSLHPHFDVHAFGSGSATEYGGIKLTAVGTIGRLDLKRFWMPIKILALALRLKPQVFIVTTHELLLTGLLLKVVLSCRLVYDLQENYALNIQNSPGLVSWIRRPLAWLVRFKERICCAAVDHLFVAESAYLSEIPWLKRRSFTLLENKSHPFPPHPGVRNRRQLLFTGTLAKSTGVFKAIKLTSWLRQVDPDFKLTIAGYAPRVKDQLKLRRLEQQSRFVTLIGIENPVPYSVIESEISKAGLGLVLYKIGPLNTSSRPTKIFEYLTARLPIILTAHAPWIAWCKPSQSAVVWADDDVMGLVTKLDSMAFYTDDPLDTTWIADEVLLPIQNLINR